jgi:hypothetical protein
MEGVYIKMYAERQIKNLGNETKVSVSGTVISKDGSTIVIDDKTGQLSILSEISVEKGNYIRAFGNLVKSQENFILQAEIVQNLQGINKSIHQKVIELLQ